MAKSRKYELPDIPALGVNQASYEKWLHRRAIAHVRRDRKRGNPNATNESYKRAIHSAVILSQGRDDYTGELLEWSLISTWNNVEARNRRTPYKAEFARLPTVDHAGDASEPRFKICGWQTNDAKNDMTYDQFVDLCRRVIALRDQLKEQTR